MTLSYKTTKHFLWTYSGILSLSLIGYLVRRAQFGNLSTAFNFNITVVSLAILVVYWETLRFVDRYLDRHLPFESGVSRRIVVQLAIGVASGILLRALIYYFGEPLLPFKLDEMFIATTWVLYAFLPASINLGFFTIHFIERWKSSLVLAEKLEKEKSQVQFDNLKNQLNPHFLFNALSSLNSLIFDNQALASQFLQQLSKVYRYVLQNKDKTVVSLDTELTFISHYVSLLYVRFSDSLTIRIEVPQECKERCIVPVTLQILIENALKHNVVDKSAPLWISIYVAGDYLVVENNIQSKRRVETSNKVGLENLRKLYNFLTDDPLLIENRNDTFVVRVPLL